MTLPVGISKVTDVDCNCSVTVIVSINSFEAELEVDLAMLSALDLIEEGETDFLWPEIWSLEVFPDIDLLVLLEDLDLDEVVAKEEFPGVE